MALIMLSHRLNIVDNLDSEETIAHNNNLSNT